MENLDLVWVYSLFSQGLVAGAGLGTIVWVIGFTISSIYKIIKRS